MAALTPNLPVKDSHQGSIDMRFISEVHDTAGGTHIYTHLVEASVAAYSTLPTTQSTIPQKCIQIMVISFFSLIY